MSLGARLKIIRGSLNQAEFARRVGSSQSGISAYEKGQRKPDYETLMRVSNGFGVRLEWLLTGEGEMYAAAAPGEYTTTKVKTSDMSEVLKGENSQSIDFTSCDKTESSDMSELLVKEFTARCLRLSDENADLLRQNGDLRVEVERQRARIAELERQLAEALSPPGGQALLDKRNAAAG